MLSRFIPLFQDFCNVINGGPRGQIMSCEPLKGCGYDDDCGMDRLCIPNLDNPEQYTCGKLKISLSLLLLLTNGPSFPVTESCK